jgi:hypothetical protein
MQATTTISNGYDKDSEMELDTLAEDVANVE